MAVDHFILPLPLGKFTFLWIVIVTRFFHTGTIFHTCYKPLKANSNGLRDKHIFVLILFLQFYLITWSFNHITFRYLSPWMLFYKCSHLTQLWSWFILCNLFWFPCILSGRNISSLNPVYSNTICYRVQLLNSFLGGL